MMRCLSVLLVLFVAADVVHADSRRSRRRQGFQQEYYQPVTEWQSSQFIPPTQPQFIPPSQFIQPPATTNQPQFVTDPSLMSGGYYNASPGADALNEVNQVRAQRGLRPYLPDPLLNQAAYAAASQRAMRLCSGHLPESDFSYIPPGGHASSAGCAAWTPDWGWGACCTYDNYTYAGAAWVMGHDGKRYMHLFVR